MMDGACAEPEGTNLTRTPTSLLERLRQPFDPEAWSRFVSLYTPLIYSWACRAGLQEQDALDLVQDVFVTLLRVLPTFSYDRDRSFKRWLRTVTLNTWRNARKPRRIGFSVEQPMPTRCQVRKTRRRLGTRNIGSTSSAEPSASCRPISGKPRGRLAGRWWSPAGRRLISPPNFG